MTWKQKTNKQTDQRRKDYSLSRKLKNENKITEEFEIMMAQLSLEEVIALKLEIATKAAGGLLYGMPMWKSMPLIVKEALLKHAVSACQTNLEAASFLGIEKAHLSKLLRKFNIDKYFEENKDLTKKE